MSEAIHGRRPPDFEVEYRFLKSEEGGRKSGPPRQGYRCPWAYEEDNVEKTGIEWEIWPEFEDSEGNILQESAPVLIQGKARMYILNNQLRQEIHRQRIHVGTIGYFMEGRRKAAKAKVTKIIGLNENR